MSIARWVLRGSVYPAYGNVISSGKGVATLLFREAADRRVQGCRCSRRLPRGRSPSLLRHRGALSAAPAAVSGVPALHWPAVAGGLHMPAFHGLLYPSGQTFAASRPWKETRAGREVTSSKWAGVCCMPLKALRVCMRGL